MNQQHGKTVRCRWARNDLSIAYHDREWGVPEHDDRVLFLSSKARRPGLSWDTILQKRENYRAAFDEFDAKTIARCTAGCQAKGPNFSRTPLRADFGTETSNTALKIVQ